MKKSIWIVDDDAGIAEAFTTILQEEGYHSVAIMHRVQMAEELKAGQPDIVFLDVNLGGEDGAGIVRQLKSSAATAHVPIILLSGAPNIAQVTQEWGAAGYVEKPCGIEEILATIKQHLTS